MSQAIFTAAKPVRLPVRVCSRYSLPRLDRELDVLHVAVVRFELLVDVDELRRRPRASFLRATSRRRRLRFEIGSGVRMPATTSSPCAFGRYSPKNFFSPVEGLRVNATPVAQSSPMLPKTIDCTLTAVPQSSGMLFSLR